MDHSSTAEATDFLNLLQVHMATLSPMCSCSILKDLFKKRAGNFSLYICISRYEASTNQKTAHLLVCTHIHPPIPLHSSFMTDSHNDKLASCFRNGRSKITSKKPSYKLPNHI